MIGISSTVLIFYACAPRDMGLFKVVESSFSYRRCFAREGVVIR
jgi:hypothetical protein